MRGSSRMLLAAEAMWCWENRVLEGRKEWGFLGMFWLPEGIVPITGAGLAGGSLGPVPRGAASDLPSPPSICYYGRLFWEWGDGIRVHESQKPQDPDKLSKEDVLSFIQTHSA